YIDGFIWVTNVTDLSPSHTFWKINASTGTVTQQFTTNLDVTVGGLAYSSGFLYAMTGPLTTPNNIWKINPSNGVASLQSSPIIDRTNSILTGGFAIGTAFPTVTSIAPTAGSIGSSTNVTISGT